MPSNAVGCVHGRERGVGRQRVGEVGGKRGEKWCLRSLCWCLFLPERSFTCLRCSGSIALWVQLEKGADEGEEAIKALNTIKALN